MYAELRFSPHEYGTRWETHASTFLSGKALEFVIIMKRQMDQAQILSGLLWCPWLSSVFDVATSERNIWEL